jgi:hypothetical protein
VHELPGRVFAPRADAGRGRERRRDPRRAVLRQCGTRAQHGGSPLGTVDHPVGGPLFEAGHLLGVGELGVRPERSLFGQRHRVVDPCAVHRGARKQNQLLDAGPIGGIEHPMEDLVVARRTATARPDAVRQVHDRLRAVEPAVEVVGEQVDPLGDHFRVGSIGESVVEGDHAVDLVVGTRERHDPPPEEAGASCDDDSVHSRRPRWKSTSLCLPSPS